MNPARWHEFLFSPTRFGKIVQFVLCPKFNLPWQDKNGG
jgi:hypothetical protein